MISKRKELKISQQELSELVDCHINTINNIETKRANPSFEMVVRLALVLDISLDKVKNETKSKLYS